MAPGGHVLTIDEGLDDGRHRVVVHGRLDVRTAADARAGLHRAVAAGTTTILLDLSGATIGDSTGLGVLVECHRRARRAGLALRVVGADDRTRRLLRRARLGSLLTAGPAAGCEPAVLAGAAG